MNFTLLSEQIASQDVIEWIGLVTGIAYVVLAAYERPSCWIFGIISSLAIAWKSFVDYLLIADGILQVFYVVIGFIGLYNWITDRGEDRKKLIVTTPLLKHLIAIILCFIASFPISYLLINYTNAKYGFIDTVITALSIWATILLVKKDLHNWLYWIVLDIALAWLYYKSGGYLFSLLMLIYTCIAFFGFVQWRKQRSALQM